MRNDMPDQGNTKFQIFLDGTPCSDVVTLFGDVDWKQYGKELTVVGDSHEVRVDVVSGDGWNEAGAVFIIDQVEVFPLSGPGAAITEVPCPEPTREVPPPTFTG
jgi:hypothetical protein